MNLSKLFLSVCFVAAFFSSCKNEKKPTNILTGKSTEGSISFLKNPSSGNCSLPRLFGTDDSLFMSWVEEKDSTSILYYSRYTNGSWEKPFEVNSGDDWFINWADFPAIAENNGNILISHLQKSADGKYTYDAKINLFSAETKTWQKNILLHTDGTASEHGFVSVVPQGKSSFYVIWLDGRNTAGGHSGHDGQGAGAMTLRSRLVHANGTMQPDVALDTRVCDCCQTSIATIDNAPIMVYRDRSEKEIRDIAMIGLFNDFYSASKPVFEDNWEIPGCPVNGPAIATYKNSVAVAWFTAANGDPKVQLAFSSNKGKTFAKPIKINAYETLGRVDVVMIAEDTAVVSWMENVSNETLIKAMRVSANGIKGLPVVISKTSFERASGFPQLEVVGNIVYAAWTMVTGAKSAIETASVSISNL